MHRRRFTSPITLLLIAWLAGLLLASLSGCAHRNSNNQILVTVSDEGGGQAEVPHTRQQVLALARAEGELTWFTSIPEREAKAFAALFEKKYPFLRVRLVRESTFGLVSRIEQQLNNGDARADVLHVLDPAIFVALRQRGELEKYNAPDAAVVAPQYKDPGYWTAARIVTVGIAYDSKHLSAAQAPKTWSALLEHRWQGKLGLKDAQTAGSAYAEYYCLRDLYGQAFWERMANLQPRIYKTDDDLLHALMNGEIQVIAGVNGYRLDEYQRAGHHDLRVVWPRDGVPLIIGPVAILTRAPHPNAARLFVDFMLSRQGQADLRDLLGAYSPRPDLAPPKGMPPLSELKLLAPDEGWDEYLQKQGPLRAEYTSLFHSDSE